MLPIENLFQVPSLSKNPVKSSVLAVIDSSGSMSSYWGVIADNWNAILAQNPDATAITFSNTAKIVKGPLSHRIQDYEGAGTEIERGFAELNSVLKSDANIHPNLTIIFVSDGCDNSSSTLAERLKKLSFQIDKTKKCNFLSLAVGKGFPTFVAMTLREMYHNGDSDLPPDFLIESPSSQTITEQFTLLTPYLVHRSKYKIHPPVKVFPWAEATDTVQECQWVLTTEKTLVINEDSFDVLPRELVGIQSFIDVVRSWLQELQLLSIKRSVLKESGIAIEFIQEMKGFFEKKQTAAEKEKNKKISFYDRLMKRNKGDFLQDLNTLIKEIKSFSEDNLLNKLSEQEAAKRLAIGTKVGKYHSKAMQIRGFSVEDFQKIKQDFIKFLPKFKLSPESSQENSIVILQNQKEIFSEKDLLDGLTLCPSQYDLVETLPLVGHSVRLHRSEGSQINPWLIQVKEIAKHHKVLDTVTIQANGNEMKLKVGNDEEEIVNGVLPLFDEKDYDLQPFINSKIFHLLMTFNVMQNVDTLYENAYCALMGAATVYLYGIPENEWRNNLLTLINKTMKITYAESLGFQKYCEILVKQPNLAMVTENMEIPVKCEELSKPILALHYMQLKDKKKLKEILYRIFIEFFGRGMTGETEIKDYFILEDEHVFEKVDLSPFCNQVLKKYNNEVLNTFYTKFELKDDVEKEIRGLDLKLDFEFNVKLNEKNLYFDHFKINLRLLEKIYYQFTGEKMDRKNYFFWVYHSITNKNSFDRNTNPVVYDEEFILQRVKSIMKNSFLNVKTIFDKIWTDLENKFCDIVTEQHFKVIPMTENDLKEYCQKNGLDASLYKFNTCSNLLTNACLCPICPFFMKLNNSLAQHLAGDRACYPGFNKTVKILSKEPDNQKILEHIMNLDYLEKLPVMPKAGPLAYDKHVERKEEILKFIDELKKFYEKLA